MRHCPALLMLEWHRCCSSQTNSVFIWPAGGRDRRGGPVLTFPARSNHDRIRQEDLRRLIAYLAGIPRYYLCLCVFVSVWTLLCNTIHCHNRSVAASRNIEGLIPRQHRHGSQPAAGNVKFRFSHHCVHLNSSRKDSPAFDIQPQIIL